MSVLKRRIEKLEQSIGIDFDMNRSLEEWSLSELIVYMKSVDPHYVKPDLSQLSLGELRGIVYES